MKNYKFSHLPKEYEGDIALRWYEDVGDQGAIYRDGSCSCRQFTSGRRCAHADEYALIVAQVQAQAAPRYAVYTAAQIWLFLLVAIMSGQLVSEEAVGV